MSHNSWYLSVIYTKYPTEQGKEKGEKTPLPHFLTWLYRHVHLLIVLSSYWGTRPQKELWYQYPTLQLIKKLLNFLRPCKTQAIGVLTIGSLCRTPCSVKPSLKYISLNLEVVPADLYKRPFPDAEPSLLFLFASRGPPGSSHGPSAPLLVVQSELPRKVGAAGVCRVSSVPEKSGSGEGHGARTASPLVVIANISRPPTLSAKCFHEAVALWTSRRALPTARV